MGPTLHPTPAPTLHLVFNERRMGNAQLESLLDTLDELHDAASEGTLPQMTNMSKTDLLAWLNEVIYTAQETLTELESTAVSEASGKVPPLALVRKSS